MKNLQINTSPIGAQEYNLGEKVGEDIYIYGEKAIESSITHIEFYPNLTGVAKPQCKLKYGDTILERITWSYSSVDFYTNQEEADNPISYFNGTGISRGLLVGRRSNFTYFPNGGNSGGTKLFEFTTNVDGNVTSVNFNVNLKLVSDSGTEYSITGFDSESYSGIIDYTLSFYFNV